MRRLIYRLAANFRVDTEDVGRGQLDARTCLKRYRQSKEPSVKFLSEIPSVKNRASTFSSTRLKLIMSLRKTRKRNRTNGKAAARKFNCIAFVAHLWMCACL